MFEDATFHSRGILHDQTPRWMLLAMAVNLSIFAALVIAPLIYPDGISARMLSQVLYAPVPPAAAPVETRRLSASGASAQALNLQNPYLVPRQIPISINRQADDGPPAISTSVEDGIPGGAPTVPDVLRSHGTAQVVAQAAHSVTVSQGVAAGLLLSGPAPAYPAIARAMRIAGTVMLAATISKAGTIENLRVLSGPAVLRSAALEAVGRWRYKPYLLNNEPVEVETTVNVVFTLN